MIPTLVTLIVFLAFVQARRMFDRLPLHYDTGFYVTPHTVVTGRMRFQRGWNARYAACSKVLPEYFFSSAYLAARRKPRQHIPAEDARAYARLFRFRLTLYQFATAVLVGLLSLQLSGGNLAYYYAGMIAFCLLVCEPHYGNYHECAESFELLPQVSAILLMAMGTMSSNTTYMAVAAFLWALDAFFIKLSSLVSLVALLAIMTATLPNTLMPMVSAVAPVCVVYLCWRGFNGAGLRASWKALLGHEQSFNRRAGKLNLVYRVREKLHCAGRLMARQPVIPLLAGIGLVLHGTPHWLLIAYIAATALACLAQATDCRYYFIPLLPPLAILSAFGAVSLGTSGIVGAVVLLALFLIWLHRNLARPAGMTDSQLNAWCWRGFRPESEILRNERLEHEAPRIIACVNGRSMLVYGPLTQAYVLVGTGYDIPLISPDHHLDDMEPEWQVELNRRMVRDPPAFVLDTNRCFAAAVARSRLALDYRLVLDAGADLWLYELKHRNEADAAFESAMTFAPVSSAQLDDERRLGSARQSAPMADEVESRLQALLNTVRENGHRRLAIYGAGRFTIRHADVYRTSPVPVSLVLDDRSDRVGSRFLDWPLRSLNDVSPGEFDAVIVSTDRFVEPMLRRIREQWRGQIPAYSLR